MHLVSMRVDAPHTRSRAPVAECGVRMRSCALMFDTTSPYVVLKREIRPTRNFNLHSDNDAAGWHGCFLFRVVLLAPRGFLQRYKKRE